jgi:hypothetical protein
VNNKLERMWKNAVVVLSRNLPGGGGPKTFSQNSRYTDLTKRTFGVNI